LAHAEKQRTFFENGAAGDERCSCKSESSQPSQNGEKPEPAETTKSPEPPVEGVQRKAKFCKPSVAEVAAYIRKRKYHFDAEMFVAFYEANGWVQGRRSKPIKSWKAACTVWEYRWRADHPGQCGYTVTAEDDAAWTP
jgi:hypothetical protein